MSGKRVTVVVGKCATCGREVSGTLHELDFLDRDGRWQKVARVEGHCGRPGHNLYACTVSKAEFDSAKNGAVI